jgi:hypothetical protein
VSNATTSNATATVDTYIAMWNETDPTKRAALIEQAWASDGRYLDPQLEADGAAAISGMVAAVHERFPGHRFRLVSGVDQHHDQIRFGWELFAPDGTITVGGIDIGELTADGRLRRIIGFFGPLPEEAAA